MTMLRTGFRGLLALVLCAVSTSCPHPPRNEPSAPRAAPPPHAAVPVDAPDARDAAPLPDCPAELVRLSTLEHVRALVERERCNGHAFDGRYTALMRAAELGRADIVTYLVQAGADVNFQLGGPNRYVGTAEVGQTALWSAIYAKHPEIVRTLVAGGADPNLFPPEGLPLLILAVVNDSLEIAQQLIDAGVDITQTTRSGATVMTAAKGPSAAMFELLTRAGVSPTGLSQDVIDSLRWEAAHRPKPGAAARELVAFEIAVIKKTRSARSREDAIVRLRKHGNEARAAVPVLLDVLRGNELSRIDWSRPHAARTLAVIGWTRELDAALANLLALLPKAPAQVRVETIQLIATQGPASRSVIRAFLNLLRHGPDPDWGARGLGLLLSRPLKFDKGLLREARKALEKAAKSDEINLSRAASEALKRIDAGPPKSQSR